MNSRTAKLINLYCRITGKKSRDVKRWWNSMLDKDRCKSRRNMHVITEEYRRKVREERAKVVAA